MFQKHLIVIGILVCIIGLGSSLSPAHAATMSKVRPFFTASGGGCYTLTDTFPSAPGVSVTISPCISGRGDLFGWTVYPDGYVSFHSPVAGWSNCFVTLKLWDGTLGTNPETQSFPCTSDANLSHQNVHHALAAYSNSSSCPQGFQTSIAVQGIWAGRFPIATSLFGPVETINC